MKPHAARGPVVVGILGGIGSGKSAVAQLWERLGATRVDADQLGHRVLQQSEVRDQLVARWGEEILDAAGEVARSAVARRVFGANQAQELAFLESVTHPRIGDQIQAEIARAAELGVPLVVLDAAVLDKTAWVNLCDRILFVDVPRAERWRRVQARGWTAEEFAAREAAQPSLEMRRQRANTIIDNSGRLEDTFEQVRRIWSEWITSSASGSASPRTPQ